jgi:hypothetical protein
MTTSSKWLSLSRRFGHCGSGMWPTMLGGEKGPRDA